MQVRMILGCDVVKPISTGPHTSNFQGHCVMGKRSDQVSHSNTSLILILWIPHMGMSNFTLASLPRRGLWRAVTRGRARWHFCTCSRAVWAESVLTEVLEHEYTQQPPLLESSAIPLFNIQWQGLAWSYNSWTQICFTEVRFDYFRYAHSGKGISPLSWVQTLRAYHFQVEALTRSDVYPQFSQWKLRSDIFTCPHPGRLRCKGYLVWLGPSISRSFLKTKSC